MNIIEIYKKYHLPENLQMHMLRVAACSNLIIDNWNGPDIAGPQKFIGRPVRFEGGTMELDFRVFPGSSLDKRGRKRYNRICV